MTFGRLLPLILTAAAPDPDLLPDTARSVTILAAALDRDYPIAPVAVRYAAMLRDNLRSGRYRRLTGCQLADRLDADLQAVHIDHHLRIDCTVFSAAAPPFHSVDATPPERPTAIGVAQRWDDLSTFYITSPGPWLLTDETCEQVTAAMRLAAGARYLVIDLRDNPGGTGVIGNLLASYLYPLDEGHPLVRGVFRDPQRDTIEGTYPYVPGPRLDGAKVFILVNAHTASAAEGLAFGLQHAKRATVVGQTTVGAGIAYSPVDFGDGLTADVPVKLIVAPDGSPGWEGTGVKPDVPVAPGGEIERVRALIAADLKKAR